MFEEIVTIHTYLYNRKENKRLLERDPFNVCQWLIKGAHDVFPSTNVPSLYCEGQHSHLLYGLSLPRPMKDLGNRRCFRRENPASNVSALSEMVRSTTRESVSLLLPVRMAKK